MILGIGTDLVDIARMRAALDLHGERFARRILSPAEWPDWESSKEPARLLAKRFAAKEAFAKASGQGLRAPVTLGALAVTHDALGRPGWAFADELAQWLTARGVQRCHLSISDERAQCLAFVVLEGGQID
ncbi:holo-ACP synthase [Rivihabitans pingtungensis]|uniref:holo-ACP synthase n=1 Tax=Rivihabitans pingtungensis TaxID=1054498 RepID=UPI00235374D1|nr:holo-ACP synthase [Rivihabitans pingtungensis]MCK6435838.1 holo-ACP synthase [Rivihabitans pingtungensis]